MSNEKINNKEERKSCLKTQRNTNLIGILDIENS